MRVTRHSAADFHEDFQRDVLPILLQAQGLQVLHAGAARMRAGVVALSGSSGTGKSTLACALGLRGRTVWADDALAIFDGRAIAIPFALRPRTPFRRMPRCARTGQCAPLAAILLLHRADRLEARRCTGAEAFPLLLKQAYCFTLTDEQRKRRLMEDYMAIAARVPIYELRFPTGLDTLEATLDMIERITNHE